MLRFKIGAGLLAVVLFGILALSPEGGKAQNSGSSANFSNALSSLSASSLLGIESDTPTDEVARFQPPLLSGSDSEAWIKKTNSYLLQAINKILPNKSLKDQYMQKEQSILNGFSADQSGSMSVLIRSVFIQRVLGR